MMLVGEPGIGKTRTSEEFATYARLRNVQVLWGRCYEGEGAPAYWPWVQIIRSYVHDKEPKELMSEMGPGAADIAQVVSEVKERLPGLPAPPALEPDQARFRLFDSITTFLKNASKDSPLMVVLDDMHWADKPSLLLLQFLAKELRGCRLLVLGTYRDVELRRQHPLAQTLGDLNRENLSQRVLLRGLTENDVRRFVEVTAGTSPLDALVKAVYRETEGNPFFVNEIVRLLVADGRLEQAETVREWSVTIPQSVREVVGRRLDHLSEECNRVLTIGSVIGREFGLRVLERVSEVRGDRLLEALEEAMGARVIAELPRSIDQYWFSHALIRETLYEELSTTRRVRLHRQIGEALEDLDMEGNLPQLAYHFCEAAPGGDVDKAVDYARRAGERASALYAYEEAVVHYERALQALELAAQVDETARCDLLLALGGARFGTGELAESRKAYKQAYEVAKGLGEWERQGLAAAGYGRHFEIGETQQDSVALLRDALSAVPEKDSALRARLLATLSIQVYFGSYEEWRDLSGEAVAVARRAGDRRTLVWALWATLFSGIELALAEERLAVAGEMLEIAEEVGDRELLLQGVFGRIANNVVLGYMPAAYEAMEKHDQVCREVRLPFYAFSAELMRGMRALMDGDLENAEHFATQAFTTGQRGQAQNAMQMFGVQTFAIRREQGRLQEMEPATRGFVQQFPAIPAWRTGLAYIFSELGRDDEAQKEFEILAHDNFKVIPRDGNWPIALGLLAETCAYLGDAERAAFLYGELLPHAERCIVVGPVADMYGSTSRSLGKLADTMERWDDAERHFAHALARNAEIGAKRWLGWTQFGYAQMLLRRNGTGDREKAIGLLNEAIDLAQPRGMKALLERSLALKLKAQGVDLTDIGSSIDTVAREALAEQPDLKAHAATEKTARLGDKAWMEVLREHNAIVREQIAAFGGFEVKSEGDGFMMAFQSAGKALACASEIQNALAERNQSAEEPIRVRIGLHSGEVIKEGEDFFGRNVIMAARVASQARGGEILTSSVLKALVEGSDIPWSEPRTEELKGLPGKHDIWAVEWHK